MKKGTTYIETPKLQGIVQNVAEKFGVELKAEPQKGFIKVTGPTPDRAVYFGNGKTVGRVDLSGFTHELGVQHRDPPTKRVQQMLDFSQDEATILRGFFRVLVDGLVKGQGETIKVTRGTTQSDPEAIAAAVAAACNE
jgi:hypothetical protein